MVGWKMVLASLLAGSAGLLAQAVCAQSIVPPLPVTGLYPVACTNVEQDLSRLADGETVEQYWRGASDGGKERYVDALFVSPADALLRPVTPPNDADLYDRWAGATVSYAFIACYPTTAANTRSDYVLPRGVVVPRMQRGADPPILPSAAAWPVMLFSHGYGGSPLDSAYLRGMIAFASWGYVTVAPFHGDLRYSAFGPDAPQLKAHIPIWSEFVAMQATRALSLSAALDVLLARPEWREHLNVDHVSAFGISQGGETVLLLGGADLNYNVLTFASKRVTLDARVRAGVGYIAYFGVEAIPAFGNDQAGAQAVTMPYLALSGTADSIAPASLVREALDRMTPPRGQVLLNGVGHELDPASGTDIMTWTLNFIAAWVSGDASAKSRMTQIDSVEGGLDDHKAVYVEPGNSFIPGVPVDTIEYFNAATGRYFFTANADEIATLDAGAQVAGWRRTGYAFKVDKLGTGPGNDACRFYGRPGIGPDSHFYTINGLECSIVASDPGWIFEGFAFRAVEPLSSGCPSEYTTVTRLYNNGMGGQVNHRWLTDATEIDRTVARGWTSEGPKLCVPR